LGGEGEGSNPGDHSYRAGGPKRKILGGALGKTVGRNASPQVSLWSAPVLRAGKLLPKEDGGVAPQIACQDQAAPFGGGLSCGKKSLPWAVPPSSGRALPHGLWGGTRIFPDLCSLRSTSLMFAIACHGRRMLQTSALFELSS